MSQIILDMGSGNTCKNDKSTIRRMIHAVSEVDTGKHEVILKWQLFKSAPPNVPLTHEAFEFAYEVAGRLCYKTTSSVFDIESLRFLARFDVQFIKIANRPDLYALAQYTKLPVYVSTAESGYAVLGARMMACVSKYPATIEEYEVAFTREDLDCVSDHTCGWDLYKKYNPSIIEKHFVHIREAVTPDQLREIL
jgi:sialic acid synthase SpsE